MVKRLLIVLAVVAFLILRIVIMEMEVDSQKNITPPTPIGGDRYPERNY